LSKWLAEHNVAYVFLGEELGARTSDLSCYVDGKVQYERLARTALFRSGLDRVEEGTLKYEIVLMCAEKEPLACHRSILVARHLVRRALRVRHIVDEALNEDHEESMRRLLSELRIDHADMFRTRDELVELAYELQGAKIAFRRDEMEDASFREPAHR
jgi:uncharacterized protein (DUF488 family)